MWGRMGEGRNRVGGSVWVCLDAALVRVILQIVLHVRDGLWRDEPRHGVMRSSKLVGRGDEDEDGDGCGRG